MPTTPAPSKTAVGVETGTVYGSSARHRRRLPRPRDLGARSVASGTPPPVPSPSSLAYGADDLRGLRLVRAASTEDDVQRCRTPVPPTRRSSVEAGPSGTRTTACLTASCPRSIDCDTRAVPVVAAIEPIATPTIVPVTPKLDAMSAAITAPTAEARICRKENFTRWES